MKSINEQVDAPIISAQQYSSDYHIFLSEINTRLSSPNIDSLFDCSSMIVPNPHCVLNKLVEDAIAGELDKIDVSKIDKNLDIAQVVHSIVSNIDIPLFSELDKKSDPIREYLPKKPIAISIETIEKCYENSRLAELPYRHIDQNECVFKVSIYPQGSSHISEEYLLLGSQPLTVLRSIIKCPISDPTAANELDPLGLVDLYSMPQIEPLKISACLFIENCFYDDTSDPSAIRYSKEYLEWLDEDEHKRPEFSPCEAKLMQNTLFRDIKFKVGSLYFFQHLGDCKHLFQFSSLRSLHPSDNQNYNAYPLRVLSTKIGSRPLCQICNTLHARYASFDDKLGGPSSPTLWCNKCFDLMHYDSNGRALYDGYTVHRINADY